MFRDVMDLGTLRKTPVCCFSAIRDIADIHVCKIIDSLLMRCGKTKIKILNSFYYAFRVCGFYLFCFGFFWSVFFLPVFLCFLCQKGKMSLICIIHSKKSVR